MKSLINRINQLIDAGYENVDQIGVRHQAELAVLFIKGIDKAENHLLFSEFVSDELAEAMLAILEILIHLERTKEDVAPSALVKGIMLNCIYPTLADIDEIFNAAYKKYIEEELYFSELDWSADEAKRVEVFYKKFQGKEKINNSGSDNYA